MSLLLGKRAREELPLNEQLAEACAGGGFGGPGPSPPADERHVRRLIGKGASVTASKALHMAAANDQPAIIPVLLQLGGSVDDVDEVGHTALHVASAMRQTRCIQALIANGAKETRNARGHTPLEAARREKASTNRFMESMGLGPGGPNRHYVPAHTVSCEEEQWQAVKQLLGGGRHPASGGGRGNTRFITLGMYRNGKSISEIAAERSLQTGTIEDHLADLYKSGDFPEALTVLGLTDAVRAEIRGINSRLAPDEAGQLKPIKDRCAHSYAVIKLALA